MHSKQLRTKAPHSRPWKSHDDDDDDDDDDDGKDDDGNDDDGDGEFSRGNGDDMIPCCSQEALHGQSCRHCLQFVNFTFEIQEKLKQQRHWVFQEILCIANAACMY